MSHRIQTTTATPEPACRQPVTVTMYGLLPIVEVRLRPEWSVMTAGGDPPPDPGRPPVLRR